MKMVFFIKAFLFGCLFTVNFAVFPCRDVIRDKLLLWSSVKNGFLVDECSTNRVNVVEGYGKEWTHMQTDDVGFVLLAQFGQVDPRGPAEEWCVAEVWQTCGRSSNRLLSIIIP